MDARPQRPVRALHAAMTDENVVLPSKKVDHQGHKSASNLLAMAGGGLKMTAKRTALNEVSNVSKAIARDEPGHIGKSVGTLLVKPPVVSDKIQRPAQRFVGQIDVKNDSKDKENDHPSTSIAAPQPRPVLSIPQPKTHIFVKRATAPQIYKDAFDSVSAVSATSAAESQATKVTDNQTDTNSVAATESYASLHEQPQSIINTGHQQVSVQLDATSSATLRDTHNNPQVTSITGGPVQNASNTVELVKYDRVTAGYDNTEGVVVRDRQLQVQPAMSEPEEYWEEEDEGPYDEQGYTVLQTFRHRNDNFTTGSTTILVPQVDLHTQQELAYAKQFVELNRSVEEIDDEAWDTTMVAEYGDEIFAYMRQLELKMTPNPHYMEDQSEIQWSMRAVLMDWLVQVHRRFGLLPETLFLCVNYIDRFLSNKIVSLGKLQLVGATAIFVAAKYEEINCPSVAEIVYMVDGGYTVDEILKAERFMLSMLQFELGWPGPMSFLRRISKADDYDLDTRTLAKYFLEVTIMDERFVAMPPSYTAAGSHCLARLMLGRGLWGTAHVHYSGYTYVQLKPLLDMMLDCLREPEKHHGAVYEKYTDRRFKCASLFVSDRMRHGFNLPPHPPRLGIQGVTHEYLQRHHMLSSNKV